MGHNELAAKACPIFDVQKWLKEIGIRPIIKEAIDRTNYAVYDADAGNSIGCDSTRANVPATDYDAMIGTFAGFVGGVVVLTEGLKGLFTNMKGWVTQLVSWCVGLVWAVLLWWLDAGFVSDVSWDIALPLWFWCLTCSQSDYRPGLVQWVIGLFRKKREEAE